MSEDETAIQGVPRSRFGLVSEPPTLILKLDAALAPVFRGDKATGNEVAVIVSEDDGRISNARTIVRALP